MVRQQITSHINKIRSMSKVKELEQTLLKLKASLQSMRKKDSPDSQQTPQ